MTLFCSSLTGVSNVISYVFPTLTPTPTRTQTPTPTVSSGGLFFCAYMTVTISQFDIDSSDDGLVYLRYQTCGGHSFCPGNFTNPSYDTAGIYLTTDCYRPNSTTCPPAAFIYQDGLQLLVLDSFITNSGVSCVAPTPTPTRTNTPTNANVLLSQRSSSSLVSGDACLLSLSINCYITPGYGRVYTNSLGTIPFNGLGRIWRLQINSDIDSISATVSSTGFITLPALCSPI